MTAADLFVVVQEDQNGQHCFTLLEPNGAEWLDRIAAIYRDLRTETVVTFTDGMFEGLDFNLEAVKRRLVETQVPDRDRGRGQLAVVRSDLAEVALALAGEQLRQYVYGYRSTRDRELVPSPGRGIDQIGVSKAEVGERVVIYLSLGEAKLSSEARVPPRVVNTGDDSLHAQHLGHLADREATHEKIVSAARRATDPETATLLLQAAFLWERQESDALVVRCTSMLVRGSASSDADAGTFRSAPDDYLPGAVDFMLLRLPTDDIEAVIDQFQASAARVEEQES